MTQEWRITIWGVRGSTPTVSPECMEYGGNTSCTGLDCGGSAVVLDAGSGLTALAFCRLMALAGKGAHRFPAIEERHLDRFIPISPETQPRLETALQGKILFTPGHTSDSISLVIGDIIFCGDAAMNGIPSLNRITIWIEDKGSFYLSWDILMAENASLLYPAHGKPFDSNDLKRYQNRISAVRLYPLADRSYRMK